MDKTQAMIHEMKAAYACINAGEFFKAKKHLEFALDYLRDIESVKTDDTYPLEIDARAVLVVVRQYDKIGDEVAISNISVPAKPTA